MVPAPWARHAAGDVRAGRRHRRPPHAQRRARPLPLGPDHPRPVAAVRRRRVPPHRSTTCGSTPTPSEVRRELPGPDRAGAGLGHRRHPPRPAPHGDHAAARVLRRLPRAGRRVRACRSGCRRRSRAEQAGFPFRRLAAEEGVVFPDHFDHDWRAGSRERVYAAIARPAAGRHRDPRPAGDRHARGAGAVTDAADGWIDDLALVDRRPDAAGAARRGRRRADRLPRAQGRACERG